MVNKQRVLESAEYILGLLAAVGLFLLVQLNMSYELKDPDIWLHLKTGEYIVQHNAVPKTDPFSSTMAGAKWVDHSWLVQVIFYLVFRFGGPDNLIFLSAIIMTFAFLFLFLSVYRGRRYLSLTVGILFLAVLASKIRFNIRPENFSILFFSLYLFILKKWINGKRIFLLPLIQMVWVNCHGFFILGPLMLGVFILAEKLKSSNLLPWEWPRTSLLDKESYRNLTRVFLLVCLACFINPYGYNGALYPLGVILNSLGKFNIFYRYIVELLPTVRYYKAVSAYYILIILSAVAFLLNFKRINFAYLILWTIFLGISFRINRNIIFFNFFAFVVATDGLINSLNAKKPGFVGVLPGKDKRLCQHLLKLAIIVILISWIGRSCCSLLLKRYYIFDEGRTKSALLGVASKGYPSKAADFILENNLPGNIFNHFNNGSYLIYKLFPKKKVFIDGRTELYGKDFFGDYQKILTVDRSAVDSAFNRYDINTVLLSGDAADLAKLSSYLFNNPEWALVYFDENSLIFLKNTPQNKALIGRLKIDLRKFESQKADPDKIGLKNVYPDTYIKRAWIFYYLGLDEQALNETKEALTVLPSCADAYNITGRIFIKQKSYEEAFKNLRLASIYAPFGVETLISLGDFYTETLKYDDALKMYKKLVKLNPYYAEGFYLLGTTYAKVNNVKSAVKSLRTAINLDPFTAYYYKELGALMEKNNDLKGASRAYNEAIQMGLDKNSFRILLNDLADRK